MDIRKLQRAIVDGLEDVKAANIVVFNTEHLSPLFERVIIASGTSNRQTKALASSVRETVKGRDMAVLRCEGEENGEWIIVDCGAAVVHIMQPGIRDYYNLEEIWGDKPVRLKTAAVSNKLVKAEEPAKPAKAGKAAPAKSAKKAALDGPTSKPAKVTKVTATAEKPPAKRVAAKSTAPAKKGVTRTVGTKVPAKKVAASSAPIKKIVVGAPKPARKTAAAAAKKTRTR